ncbi:hypothetical protein TWF481_003306 [Arthrobotrys musiformis]|uniref:Uncharacterized protein n=1 Tax=Arthrobotrys musiformis TaxID=47236 RepID=A0AAV9VQ00_9PEZI
MAAGTRDINSTPRKNGIPKVNRGGTLNILVYQVNADGAGAFTCKIDYLGTAQSFSQTITPTKNCHGNAKSIFVGGAKKTCQLVVPLPADMDCKGSYTTKNGKTAKNICMVRCENKAKNGPFGGCVPIQQVGSAAAKPPPPQPPRTVRLPPKVVTVNQGKTVTVTKGDIIAIPRPTIIFVNRPRVVIVRKGQIITIIIKGVPRTSICTKAGTITVTEKSTVTVQNESVVTVTQSVITISQAPQVVTVTAGATTVTLPPDNEPGREATQTPTKEEIEEAVGGEKLDPEDLEEAQNEKIDDATKEQLEEDAQAGGKSGEEPEDNDAY